MLGVPGTMISDRPLRIEYCPVISAARDGVQAGSTRNCVRRSPSRASWSMRGVGAAAQLAAAVGTHVAIADVVGKDEDDVGLRFLGGCRPGDGNPRGRAESDQALTQQARFRPGDFPPLVRAVLTR